jgi:hypothetical protein
MYDNYEGQDQEYLDGETYDQYDYQPSQEKMNDGFDPLGNL